MRQETEIRHRLTMRSGVSDQNDNVIGDFNDAKTAYLVAELLWALDRFEHAEYRGFDVEARDAAAD
jgi:hypothetical protein